MPGNPVVGSDDVPGAPGTRNEQAFAPLIGPDFSDHRGSRQWARRNLMVAGANALDLGSQSETMQELTFNELKAIRIGIEMLVQMFTNSDLDLMELAIARLDSSL